MRAAVLGQVQRAGLELAQVRAFGRALGRCPRHDVQQGHVQAPRRQVRGHLRAHGPRAQHTDLAGSASRQAGYAAPSYMRSITSLYFCSTTRRFTFSFGVSSPASMVNSRGSSAIFLIRSNCARLR